MTFLSNGPLAVSLRTTHAAVVVLEASLAACGAPSPSPSEGTERPTAAQPGYPRTVDKYLVDVAASLGIKDPPAVAVVRTVTPEESVDVINDCLQSQGWTAETGRDGSVGFTYPTDQEEAFNLAQYTCAAQYPIDAAYLQPPSSEDLEALYAHYREVHLPCLEDQGLPTETLPTLETFVAEGGRWQPLDFDKALDAIEQGTMKSFEALEAVCPRRPS